MGESLLEDRDNHLLAYFAVQTYSEKGHALG